ncbi:MULTISPECIES: hypothetical protein [Streptomyces]|uniref:hypothetical protein n=1 Tax=Streptomyces TaxID=1883 RepID=UPI001360BC51|nr:hypothetical protein [Streptomyces sp. SID724]
MSRNSHDSGSTPASDPAQAPDPRAWVAPLISTLLTLPMGLVALFVGGLTPMACDSCDGAAADRFDASFTHRIRHAARRVGLALTAPATVVVTFVAFMALVDWP